MRNRKRVVIMQSRHSKTRCLPPYLVVKEWRGLYGEQEWRRSRWAHGHALLGEEVHSAREQGEGEERSLL